MVYLSGHVSERMWKSYRGGFLLTPWMGNRVPRGARWAADTGCFKGRSFDLDRYLRWLARQTENAGQPPLFVTAPDVLADAEATFRVALPVLPKLGAEGYQPALVVQNGMTADSLPWESFSAVFVGGDDAWKFSVQSLAICEAARNRRWLHIGRVNSQQRCIQAFWFGADSVDGNYVGYGPDANWENPARWMRTVETLEKNRRLFC